MEWPAKSGRTQDFSEVDRAGWFNIPEARKRIIAAQIGFLDQLISVLGIANQREPQPSKPAN
jgi:predicted NUDIX family NTP pyrophosphohydrolase